MYRADYLLKLPRPIFDTSVGGLYLVVMQIGKTIPATTSLLLFADFFLSRDLCELSRGVIRKQKKVNSMFNLFDDGEACSWLENLLFSVDVDIIMSSCPECSMHTCSVLR